MSMDTVSLVRVQAIRLHGWLGEQPFAQRLISGTASRDEYTAFLIQTYNYIQYSFSFLRTAASRLHAQGMADLAQLMSTQAEEMAGQEAWLLSDLRALGYPGSAVEAAPVHLPIRTYVFSNLLTVEHGSAVGVLGTAHVLTFLSVKHAEGLAASLLRVNVIPHIRDAVRFLTGHGKADPRRLARLEDAIGQVTASDDCQAILGAARATREQYECLFSCLQSPTTPPGPRRIPLPRLWRDALTRCEQEVACGVLDGKKNGLIASERKCTEATVKRHLTSIYEKVGVSTRSELLSRYIQVMSNEWLPLPTMTPEDDREPT